MKPAQHLQCSSSNGLVSVDQFEVVVREYKKLNNETGQTEEKTTKFMEQVSTQVIYKDLNKKLCNLQKSYCSHKFLVYDNIYHWPRILATVPEYGPILQMDFSENLSQCTSMNHNLHISTNTTIHFTVLLNIWIIRNTLI